MAWFICRACTLGLHRIICVICDGQVLLQGLQSGTAQDGLYNLQEPSTVLSVSLRSPEGAQSGVGCAALQDEYCEWSVTRNAAGKITKVMFTSEGPEYWKYLARVQPDTVLEVRRPLLLVCCRAASHCGCR